MFWTPVRTASDIRAKPDRKPGERTVTSERTEAACLAWSLGTEPAAIAAFLSAPKRAHGVTARKSKCHCKEITPMKPKALSLAVLPLLLTTGTASAKVSCDEFKNSLLMHFVLDNKSRPVWEAE